MKRLRLDRTPRRSARATFAVVLVAAVFVSAAAASTVSAKKTSAAQPYAGQTITVDFLTPPPNPAFLDEFKQQTGISVNWNQVTADQLNTKVLTAMPAGQYFADLSQVGIAKLQMYYQPKWFTPLNTYFNLKTLWSTVPLSKGFAISGTQVGIPIDSSVSAVTVNHKQFAAAGITKMPATWDDYMADLAKLQSSGVNAHPLGIPMCACADLTISWYDLTFAFGGRMLGANFTPQFAKPNSAGYKAAQFLVNAYKSGLVPAQNIDYSAASTSSEMAQGTIASNLDDFTDDVGFTYNNPTTSNVVGQVSYIRTPGLKGPAPNYEFPDAMLIPSTAQHPGAAAAFLAFLISPKANAQLSGLSGPDYEAPGFPDTPVSQAAVTLLEQAKVYTKSHAAHIQSLLQASQPGFPYGAPPWYAQWNSTVFTNLHAAILGQETVDQAINNIVNTVYNLRGPVSS
jgi:multiple sugar transport system substrate-binding protein